MSTPAALDDDVLRIQDEVEHNNHEEFEDGNKKDMMRMNEHSLMECGPQMVESTTTTLVDLPQQISTENLKPPTDSVGQDGGDEVDDEQNDNSDAGGKVEEDNPVFDWILQCERRSDGNDDDDDDDDDEPVVWLWHSPTPPTALSKEEALVTSGKLLRWGAKERGMMKSQPDWRKEELKRMAHKCGVSLPQALSLRRHHMKQLNSFKTMSALGLGNEQDIQRSSRIFEQVVADLLVRHGISFYSEREQRQHIEQHRQGRAYPPTPDFLLRHEIVIEKYYHHHHHHRSNNNNNNHNNNRSSNSRKRGRAQHHESYNHHHQQHRNGSNSTSNNFSTKKTIQRQAVCWLDAKMFYGASTIDHDNKSAVGCVLSTARKYTAVFGPGAFVFLQGYGDRLARELQQEGVLALDCSGDHVAPFLRPVQEDQRTWCADANGEIWP